MKKRHQLLSVGSWAPFDHLFRMSRYPQEGETITVQGGTRDMYYGDCSFNIAYVAAKLGIRSALAAIVGNDFDQSGYREHLTAAGVSLEGLTVRGDVPSGHNYLFFDDEGKGFCFSHLGAAEDQENERIPDGLASAAEHVVVSEKFSPYTLDALQQGRRSGATTYVNGMVETAGELLDSFLSLTDVLFINESEYSRLLHKLSGDPAKLFDTYGVRLLFVTMGSRGCRLLSPSSSEIVPIGKGPQAVVDTTGAGDSFAAGAISALIKGYPARVAAQVGATVASFVIEAWGCQTRVPDWTEMAARYRDRYGGSPDQGKEGLRDESH